jgi:hypothetical protein
MRPVADPLHQAMFHGVVVNVTDMPREVVIVADRVLPIPPLPKRELTIAVPFDVPTRFEQMGAEISFDAPPPARKICIVSWQTEDGVQVIRQDHDGIDRKWSLLPGHTKCGAKRADMIDKNDRLPIGQRQREEEFSTGDAIASVSDHSGMIPRISLRSSGLRLLRLLYNRPILDVSFLTTNS